MILIGGADSQQVYHGRDGESVFLRCSGAERMYTRSGEGMAVRLVSIHCFRMESAVFSYLILINLRSSQYNNLEEKYEQSINCNRYAG